MLPFTIDRVRALVQKFAKIDFVNPTPESNLAAAVIEMAEELEKHKTEIQKLKQDLAKLKK